MAQPPQPPWAFLHFPAPSCTRPHEIPRTCSFPHAPAAFRFQRPQGVGVQVPPRALLGLKGFRAMGDRSPEFWPFVPRPGAAGDTGRRGALVWRGLPVNLGSGRRRRFPGLARTKRRSVLPSAERTTTRLADHHADDVGSVRVSADRSPGCSGSRGLTSLRSWIGNSGRPEHRRNYLTCLRPKSKTTQSAH